MSVAETRTTMTQTQTTMTQTTTAGRVDARVPRNGSHNFQSADSRVFLMHSILSWGGNAFWALFILLKLDSKVSWSWWLVFLPRWLAHSIHLPLQVVVILATRSIVEKQMEPPPSPLASEVVLRSYDELKRTRMRAHRMSNLNNAIHSVSLLMVKIIFCYQLENIWEQNGQFGSFRLIFLPFWFSWFLTNIISFTRNKKERTYGNIRELQYVFFLFVACKLDHVNNYSWKTVFIIPWVSFAVMFCMACMILFMLITTRYSHCDRLLQMGIFSMFVSFTPQFISYQRLVITLDSSQGFTYQEILVPNILSWVMLFVSSLIMFTGLRERELMRIRWLSIQQALLDRHLEGATLEAGQASVYNLTDEEVAHVAQEMAMGKVKPRELWRVSTTLFRRLTQSGEVVSADAKPEEKFKLPEIQARGAGSTEQEEAQDEVREVGDVLGEDEPSPRISELKIDSPGRISSSGSSHNGERDGEVSIKIDSPPEDDDRDVCIICCDMKASAVFLDCGHSGVCLKCAHKIWIRPPHECPTCRGKIDQVVEIEEAGDSVGRVSVKQ